MCNNKKAIAGLLTITGLAVIGLGIEAIVNDPTRACGKQQIGGGPNKCFRTIALSEFWDIDYDIFYDSIHEYEIAGIDGPENYTATEGRLYVINQHPNPSSSTNSSGVKNYRLKFFQDGQMRTIEYGSDIADVPTYLVIDYTTNEVSAYAEIAAVPEQEQSYFRELENK
jgi:hypothetical protein